MKHLGNTADTLYLASKETLCNFLRIMFFKEEM